LAEPVIRVLFQHGKFSPADTIATANALRAYSVGLVFFCVVKILGPAFYALNETKIPVIASVSAVVVNIVLNFAFIKPFGSWGLALGTAFGSMVNAIVLFVFLKKRLISFGRLKQFLSIGKIFLVTSLAGLIQWQMLSPISKMLKNTMQFNPESFISAFSGLILCLIAGASALIILSRVTHIEEAERAIDMILKKLKLKK
jgi:putative peptidoglycan lipid II flippase